MSLIPSHYMKAVLSIGYNNVDGKRIGRERALLLHERLGTINTNFLW